MGQRGNQRGIGRGGADADEKWDVFRGCGQCRCSGGVFDGEEVCAGVECAADLDGAGSPAIDEHRDAETVARGFQALDVSQALYGERWGFGDVEEPSADTGCVGADRVLGQVVDGTAEWSRRECVVCYVGNIGLNDKGGADGEVERLEMGGEAEGKVEEKDQRAILRDEDMLAKAQVVVDLKATLVAVDCPEADLKRLGELRALQLKVTRMEEELSKLA